MGNRAVIATRDKDIGIYLHWNGGRDSVNAFLAYCKMKGFRSPDVDDYGWARLCQVICNYFSGGLSIGIDRYERLDTDNYDNGVYIIEDWNVVGRLFCRYEPEQNNYDFREFVIEINNCMPTREQIPYDEVLKWLDEHEHEYTFDIVRLDNGE